MPTFEQFVASLRDPSLRAGIGLVIDDTDAAALLTRQDWASDYFYRWLAMFPAAAAAAAAPPATAPPTAPVSAEVFASAAPGAVPDAAEQSTARLGAPDAQPWEAATRGPRIPSALRRPLLIVGSAVVVAALVAIGLSVYSTVIREAVAAAPIAQHSRPSGTATTGTTTNADYFHGLTRPEYDLLEAVLAPQGHTLEEAVSQGSTDSALRAMLTQASASLDRTCTQAESTPDGFDSSVLKASFIAGYKVAAKATDTQADATYAALAEYCAAR